MKGANNKLTGEYETAYQDIIGYLNASNIPMESKFYIEVQEDMKDMLFSAQMNQLPVNNIIGGDIKSFCEDIVKSYKTKEVRLLQFLKDLNFSLFWLALASLVVQISDDYRLNFLIFMVIVLFLYKYIINFILKTLTLKFKGLKNKFIFILLITLASWIILYKFYTIISKYLSIPINGYYVAVVCLLIILPVHIACRKLDNNFKWYSYLR